jgi:hypothetical protein
LRIARLQFGDALVLEGWVDVTCYTDQYSSIVWRL